MEAIISYLCKIAKSVMLNMTFSGHYCIPIHKSASITNMEDISAKNEPDSKEPCKDVVDAHLYYADPQNEDNEKLIKSIKLYERECMRTTGELHMINSLIPNSFTTKPKKILLNK